MSNQIFKRKMKKILLLLPVLMFACCLTMSCSQQKKWNHEQRQQVRNALKQYRQMVYLQDLTDAEFAIFTDSVTVDLEGAYPVYTEFIEIDGLNDTIDAVVVTTIVEQLSLDAHNMRHLYPYPYLVAEGVLPDGIDRSQQRAFYKCLAAKINNYYTSMTAFFNAVLADTTNNSQIARFQQQCASDLFGWVVEIEEIDIYD